MTHCFKAGVTQQCSQYCVALPMPSVLVAPARLFQPLDIETMFSKITRWATIAGGFAAGAIMTAELFVDAPSSFREVAVFDFILVWSLAWFLTNAIRFFDTRNERWLRLFGLLSLGLPLTVFGTFMLVNLEFPITGSNASQVSLSASALIVGGTALLSATRVPTYQTSPNVVVRSYRFD